MKVNIGPMDKTLRLAGGLLLIIAALNFNNYWIGLPGLILIGTALASRCPLYLPFGFSTLGQGPKGHTT